MSPASGNGLTAMTYPPLCFVSSSAESIRGILVPGLRPTARTRSASCKSSRLTLPLPTPSVSFSPAPLDSWHMLLQSGRLFVPYARAKLQQERRLVAEPARGVEQRFVGRIEP